LARTLNNAEEFTASIKKSDQDIKRTIENTKKFSEQLASIPLKTTVDSLDKLISSLKTTMQAINSGQGTLGALMNDRALYDQLQQTVLSAEILMDDLRTHPKRYVQVSVFGKKEKNAPLSAPAQKKALPDSSHEKK
jgi:phospholipid/cholesterol/gamma-HCH transport system substrate-binding protein